MTQVDALNSADQEAREARRTRAIRLVQGLQERTVDRGCSEEEALSNAAKVGELMQQYDLQLSDIVARDTTDMVLREVYATDAAIGTVITGIGRLCDLVVYSKTGADVTTFVLFGHVPDVELGVFLYEVCAEAAETGWVADMQVNGHTRKKRESFRAGFANRVCDRLTKLREEREARLRALQPTSDCTALVSLKNQVVVEEFVRKTGIRLTSRKSAQSIDRATYYRGAAHGSTVNLTNTLQDQRDKTTGLLA